MMFPQSSQFDGLDDQKKTVQPLPKAVRRNYKQLSEAISLQIKQEKLRKLQHFPWEIEPRGEA
jgi:hypothetical protein